MIIMIMVLSCYVIKFIIWDKEHLHPLIHIHSVYFVLTALNNSKNVNNKVTHYTVKILRKSVKAVNFRSQNHKRLKLTYRMAIVSAWIAMFTNCMNIIICNMFKGGCIALLQTLRKLYGFVNGKCKIIPACSLHERT